MDFHLPDDIGNALDEGMPKWKGIENKISNSVLKHDQIFKVAHHTTKHKLESALFHLVLMTRIYEKKGSFSRTDQFLIRTLAENIFFDLSSCLDALAHEVSRIYCIIIGFDRVQIDHQANQKRCLRCILSKLDSDFSAYLDSEFPQKPISKDHWYYAFNEYRNQVVHRTLYVVMLGPKALLLPDEASNLHPKVTEIMDHKTGEYLFKPDYSQKREIREYCLSSFDRIQAIVEKAYTRLSDKLFL